MTVFWDGIGRTNRRHGEAKRVSGLGRWYYCHTAATFAPIGEGTMQGCGDSLLPILRGRNRLEAIDYWAVTDLEDGVDLTSH